MVRSYTRMVGFFTVTAFLMIASLGCRQSVEGLGIKLNMEKRTLSNGLAIIMVEDHTVPIVSYQTWFRVGSVDEKPGITGISHLFEHLMFKGTPKYGPKQFFQELEAKGAEVNAATTRDYTVYYENFVPSLLEKVVDIEADRLENLKLDEEVLNSERMVVFEERRLRTDNTPEGKLQETLWQMAYHSHPYRWPVIGFPQDLLAITLPQLIDYFKAHYQPANATLVIVGDINPETTYQLIKKYYSKIPARPRPKRDIALEPEQTEERRMVIRDRVASERFAQAYHVTSADQDDTYALDVLANILFEGTSSRAYRRLVDEKDWVVSIAGSAFTPTFPGLFIINGVMKRGIITQTVEKELEQLIQEVQTQGVTPEEISVAVRQLTVQMVDSVRTPYGLGQLIGTVQTILNEPERFADDLGKYMKVKVSDVQKVAQKYLIPNNRSVVTLSPEPSATEVAHVKRGSK